MEEISCLEPEGGELVNIIVSVDRRAEWHLAVELTTLQRGAYS